MQNAVTLDPTPTSGPFDGLRVAVVEDDWLVSLALQEMLVGMGCRIAGAASDIGEALALISQVPHDVAILDHWLHDKPVVQVALQLMERQTPFVLATGFGVQEISPRLRHAPLLTKPYIARDVEEALESVVTQRLITPLVASSCSAECAAT